MIAESICPLFRRLVFVCLPHYHAQFRVLHTALHVPRLSECAKEKEANLGRYFRACMLCAGLVACTEIKVM